jgi:hypothetical protein
VKINLAHYSKFPLPDQLFTTPQVEKAMKPRGLWVSCEHPDQDPTEEREWTSWVGWCHGEQWLLDRLRYRAAVTLHDDANLIHLTTMDEILAFDKKFHAPLDEVQLRLMNCRYHIDWPRVAEHYQGILIYPYCYRLRLSEIMWYYPWDCASGCIWDVAAIKHIARTKGYVPSHKETRDERYPTTEPDPSPA